MQTLWATRYSQRTQRMSSSAVRELLKLTERPEIISFAGGLPAPDVFPVQKFQEATRLVLSEHGVTALQYGTTEGYTPLREMICRHSARYGIAIEPDNVMVTSGSQQALDLIGKVFINPGDHILIERPTYLGALQAWNAYQAEYISVAMDDDGMRTDELASALRNGPKFIYALPNFQNPSGVTMSMARRRALIDLADHYGVPILEDDPYGQLRYEGEHLTPIVALDARFQSTGDRPYTGNVIYLSTFSKTLSPGIRLAWIVASKEVIRKLVLAKQGTDLHTSTFAQMIAFEVARGGFLDQHIKVIRAVYGERRDVMLRALGASFPSQVTWTRPQGGLFLWLTFPEWIDSSELLRKAIADQKVAFVPGAAFDPNGEGRNTARLNFSYSTPQQIEEGIGRLGALLKKIIGAREVSNPAASRADGR
jgi:2-aminoadipate transaminase